VHVSAVLIVDDEPRIREFLVRALTPAGYDVREAPDADTALAMIADAPPDIVLCDVQMPGRDGLWLVAQLGERFPEVAIVLATADEAVPPAVSLKSGVVDYLVKPFDTARVHAALGRAIEWRKAAVARRGDAARDGDPVGKWLNGGGHK
jgi:DNA-binding NtrC family response regulator